MITKPGFISNPYSRTRGDSISAERIMEDIHTSAISGCGCWYELYHQRVINQLLSLMNILAENDQQTLKTVCEKWGFHLDADSVSASLRECEEVYEEIRKSQE
ncbi:hypothetical protein J8655_10075 [Dickeya oryzae]|uniref:hypothetical protein n=1 Tax=Dickeya oryzae TaxID=1240404 RepID=UPI001AECC360|nr:hypothetical protein [Dickeya oryzae]MBP2845825.1 hypothetical protein [Dickeya oryzae]